MKDATAIDRYWADPYLQHNPIARSGVATFKSLIGGLVMGASFSYQHLLTLADCDLAVVYGRYAQTGVIFDMFRLRDGKIMEHWDSESGASESSGLDPHDAGRPHRQQPRPVHRFRADRPHRRRHARVPASS